MYRTTITLLAVIALLIPTLTRAQAQYQLVDLGINRYPVRINNAGQIVGGDLWDESTGWQSIGIDARGINNHGVVAGSTGPYAAYWDPSSGIGYVTTEPGQRKTGVAYDINDYGIIVGSEGSNSWWSSNGDFRFMSKPAGDYSSRVYDINNGSPQNNYSVGEITQYNKTFGARWYQAGGPSSYYVSGEWGKISLSSINDLAYAVGYVQYPDSSKYYAKKWYSPHDSVDLGEGLACSINNNHVVVGSSGGVAVMWDRLDRKTDLNSLVTASDLNLCAAHAINDNDWITGIAYDSDGVEHGFLLRPIVPEPSSLLTLICGLSGVGRMIWCRRK